MGPRKKFLAVIFINLSLVSVIASAEESTSPEIVISAIPLPHDPFQSAQSVTVINKESLLTKDTSSLGSALQSELGITSTSFAPGAGRPIIRGLGGDRVKILSNGMATNDVSNTSPDHPVNTDILNAEKIEVVRGPAALLFGTTAVGGVVNVIDNNIPETLPSRSVEGSAVIRGATGDRERAAGIEATSAIDNVAFHFETMTRRADDYNIPGFARTAAKREEEALEYPEPYGSLDFSQSESQNVAFGTSYIFDRGFLGSSISYLNSDYGVPNGENNISIDMRQPRFELRGKYLAPVKYLSYLSLNAGTSDYKHTEFEGEEVGTVFTNKASDSRLEIGHDPIGGIMEGVFGLHIQNGKFKAIGEEAYQAPTETKIISPYLFEDLPLSDQVTLQAGARVDSQTTDVQDYSTFGSEDQIDLSRDFTTFSQSLGLVYAPVDNYSLGVSFAHTERAPVGQELFANGPHIATAAYEVGDPNLNPERSIGVDITARKKDGLITGSLGGFMNRFQNYIGLNANGEEIEGLPVYVFEAQPVNYYGVESLFSLNLAGKREFERLRNDLSLFVQQDWVWSEDRSTDKPLPRIPPLRIKTGIQYKKEATGARIEIEHAFRQDRVNELETETGASTSLNVSLTREIRILEQLPAILFIEGRNLTDSMIRNHASFIKDVAPLPGRTVMAGVRLSF